MHGLTTPMHKAVTFFSKEEVDPAAGFKCLHRFAVMQDALNPAIKSAGKTSLPFQTGPTCGRAHYKRVWYFRIPESYDDSQKRDEGFLSEEAYMRLFNTTRLVYPS